MLKAFADRKTTQQALEIALGDDSATFNKAFAEHLRQRWGSILDTLDEYSAVVRQLERALQFDDWVSAEALSRDLIRRYPERVGNGSAYTVLAKALREQDHEDEAVDVLLEWHTKGGHDPDSLMQLIEQLRVRQRLDESVPIMESLNWVMPYGTDVHLWLGEHYLQQEQAQLAIREFNALLGMQVDDLAAAHLGKARAKLLLDEAETAKREVLYALEQAPFYRPAQQLLLTLSDGD